MSVVRSCNWNTKLFINTILQLGSNNRWRSFSMWLSKYCISRFTLCDGSSVLVGGGTLFMYSSSTRGQAKTSQGTAQVVCLCLWATLPPLGNVFQQAFPLAYWVVPHGPEARLLSAKLLFLASWIWCPLCRDVATVLWSELLSRDSWFHLPIIEYSLIAENK